MSFSGRGVDRQLFVSSDEAALIKYQIELVSRPNVVKSGLQRLCAHLEAGRYLIDNGSFHTLVVGLLFTESVVVRRWAYKAIAYIGGARDVDALIARMRTETDMENLTWIMSAIFALSESPSVLDICRDNGAEFTDAMVLASLLYGNETLRKVGGGELPVVNVETADALTLKWCAILAGYERAPPNLFHPRLENRELLGVLNEHQTDEVCGIFRLGPLEIC